MPQVTGTITGTGAVAASVIAGKSFKIKLDFAGTASVDVEEQMWNGSWIKMPTSSAQTFPATADTIIGYDAPGSATIRLNCTSYTNDVVYSIETN